MKSASDQDLGEEVSVDAMIRWIRKHRSFLSRYVEVGLQFKLVEGLNSASLDQLIDLAKVARAATSVRPELPAPL